MENHEEFIWQPNIVTIKMSAEYISSVAIEDSFEIPLPRQPGQQYDFSTLQIVTGLRKTDKTTEFLLDKDLSQGIQFIISTMPAKEESRQTGLSLKVSKSE
ncbi:hypothetical protein [Chryseobacterium gossypii]|uniref:hypothetical protein n=1 Tax=Chryseobacterium gossypii TaxID=3231602 RepID=UPI0035253B98